MPNKKTMQLTEKNLEQIRGFNEEELEMLIIRAMNMATKYFNKTGKPWLEMLNLQQVLQTLMSNPKAGEGDGD